MATYRKGLKAATSANEWKNERQKALVLARLINAGIEVDETTPPARCWHLLTDLLVSEIR
jgi:hypothetical protein